MDAANRRATAQAPARSRGVIESNGGFHPALSVSTEGIASKTGQTKAWDSISRSESRQRLSSKAGAGLAEVVGRAG